MHGNSTPRRAARTTAGCLSLLLVCWLQVKGATDAACGAAAPAGGLALHAAACSRRDSGPQAGCCMLPAPWQRACFQAMLVLCRGCNVCYSTNQPLLCPPAALSLQPGKGWVLLFIRPGTALEQLGMAVAGIAAGGVLQLLFSQHCLLLLWGLCCHSADSGQSERRAACPHSMCRQRGCSQGHHRKLFVGGKG